MQPKADGQPLFAPAAQDLDASAVSSHAYSWTRTALKQMRSQLWSHYDRWRWLCNAVEMTWQADLFPDPTDAASVTAIETSAPDLAPASSGFGFSRLSLPMVALKVCWSDRVDQGCIIL